MNWVGGASPKYDLLSQDGAIILSRDLFRDMTLEEVQEQLRSDGFEMLKIVPPVPQGPPFGETKYGGHEYHIYNLPTDYATAKEFAESLTLNGEKGRLPTIACADQNSFLQSWISSLGIKSIWLGGSDLETEGQWKWSSGPLAGQTFWSTENPNQMYTEWRQGEPNNADKEDCMTMVSDWGWNDVQCEEIQHPILVEFGDKPVQCADEPTLAVNSDTNRLDL